VADRYFSDRESGPRGRTSEEFTSGGWGGIVALVHSLIATGALGVDYPDNCRDGRGPIGTNEYTLSLAIQAEIPGLPWPLDPTAVPPTLAILDLIEFCHEHIAKPLKGSFHDYFDHYHLNYDRDAGRAEFSERANQVLARNGMAFELNPSGQITRLAPPMLGEALASVVFQTRERELDRLLETARAKFLSPDLEVRRDALEKLWDAWERLKTVLRPEDKKRSIALLLERAAPDPKARAALDAEASELTRIGNEFRIRHSEVNKIVIDSSAQVDYLFHRMFAMIQLLLRFL